MQNLIDNIEVSTSALKTEMTHFQHCLDTVPSTSSDEISNNIETKCNEGEPKVNPLALYFSSFNPDSQDSDSYSTSIPYLNHNITEKENDFDKLVDFFSSFNPDECSQSLKTGISQTIEKNAQAYVAGYICHAIKNHDCDQCKDQLTQNHSNAINDNYIYSHNKDSEKIKYLKYASQTITAMIELLENVFQDNIKGILTMENVKNNLMKKMQSNLTTITNICENAKQLITEKYIVMRLHYFAKFFNKDLLKKRKLLDNAVHCTTKKNRKISKITHQ